jgi:hypothetical protein
MIWELTLPKRRQHQDLLSSAPHHLHDPKRETTTTATSLAVESPAQSTFRGRRLGIRELTHNATDAVTANPPRRIGEDREGQPALRTAGVQLAGCTHW